MIWRAGSYPSTERQISPTPTPTPNPNLTKDEADTFATVKTALDSGINFFDNAGQPAPISNSKPTPTPTHNSHPASPHVIDQYMITRTPTLTLTDPNPDPNLNI